MPIKTYHVMIPNIGDLSTSDTSHTQAAASLESKNSILMEILSRSHVEEGTPYHLVPKQNQMTRHFDAPDLPK
jgi:hypothetical protein